jgi:surface carbohydrate biosynthesis protein
MLHGRFGGLKPVSVGRPSPVDKPRTAPLLYLPVEASADELESKLLLSCLAVKSGIGVVIGPKRSMLRKIPGMQPGVILFNAMTAEVAAHMRLARDNGFRVIAIDDEVPGLIVRNNGLRWVSQEAVDASDVVFVLNGEHGTFLAERFSCDHEKCVVVGNPLWDLLRPEFLHRYDGEVKEIQKEYGRIILISTNLSLTNSRERSLEAAIRRFEDSQLLDHRRQADRYYVGEHLVLEVGTHNGLRALLRILPKRFPHHKLIVRPHANENAGAWQQVAEEMPQVEVVRRGSIIPWIIAADSLVHTYSIAGVEAFVLGKPAISFRPTYSHILEDYLSSQVNVIASTPEQVVTQLQRIAERNARSCCPPAKVPALFERHVVSQRGALASELIVQSLRSKFEFASNTNDQSWRSVSRCRMRTKSYDVELAADLNRPTIVEGLAWYGRELNCTRSPVVEDCDEHMFLLRDPIARRSVTDP